MNEIQIFSHEAFGSLPVVIINGIEHFGANEAANSLGFADPQKSIKNHVEPEGWTTYPVPTNSGTQQKKFLNESGLYELIFGAAKQGKNKEIQMKAKQYKRWVTSEVLPSIRKTGSYSTEKVVPLSKDQALVTVLRTTADLVEDTQVIKQEQHEIRKLITQVDQKVEEQITLDYGEQRRLQKGVAQRVYELESNPDVRPQLFREIYREIKDRFAVASYKDVKRKELQTALRYIENWIPRKVS